MCLTNCSRTLMGVPRRPSCRLVPLKPNPLLLATACDSCHHFLADDGFPALLGFAQSVVSTLIALARLCHWTGDTRERCVICSVRCRHASVGMWNSHGESKFREWRASRISLSRACSLVTRARCWLLRTPSLSRTCRLGFSSAAKGNHPQL